MKLNPIGKLNFKGKIIDSHIHIGNWKEVYQEQAKDLTKEIDVFIKSPLDNGDIIEKVIVSNLDCLYNKKGKGEPIEFLLGEIEGNKKLLELSKSNSKVTPLAVCQPGYGSVDNIKKLFLENPESFVGLKFHPEVLKISANDESYKPYMEFANSKKLPCLFHSSNSVDVHYEGGAIAKASKYSTPEQIYKLAKEYKETPIILAHWGGDGEENYKKVTDLIINSIKNKEAKIYGDISWVDCNSAEKPNLKKIIKTLKSENAIERILFGTDAPLGRFGGNGENGLSPKQAYTKMVDDVKNMIKREFPDDADKIIDKIFFENANELFFNVKVHDEKVTQTQKSSSTKSGKIVWTVGIGTLLIILISALFNKNKAEKTQEKRLSMFI